MPILLFPDCIVKQYDLTIHILNGFIYLEMRRAVWGLPQAGIFGNKCLHISGYSHTDITNARFMET
jgi:hypothetical protein